MKKVRLASALCESIVLEEERIAEMRENFQREIANLTRVLKEETESRIHSLEQQVRDQREIQKITQDQISTLQKNYDSERLLREGMELFYGIHCTENKQRGFMLIQQSADLGNASAQQHLGDFLLEGVGCSRDPVAASRYYKLSADQGNVEAQYQYSLQLLGRDRIFLRDFSLAANYLKRAIDQRDSRAMVEYGKLLYDGYGVKKDRREAAQLFKSAAQQQDKEGMFLYACRLYNGDGEERDMYEAVRYFRTLADQGDNRGEYIYGWCLWTGQGCRKNTDEAIRYFSTASDHGSFYAQALHMYATKFRAGTLETADLFLAPPRK